MNKIEVFRGQIRLNEHKTYFGLDYELTDKIGNLIDDLDKLKEEKQKLIDYLKEQIKLCKDAQKLALKNKMIEQVGNFNLRIATYNEILSKIEKEH